MTMKKVLWLLLPLMLFTACSTPADDPKYDDLATIEDEIADLERLSDETSMLVSNDIAFERIDEEVMYLDGNSDVKGYLVVPKHDMSEQLPALVLIHEWWGLNDQVKEMARRFATQGYVVLAVDMYGAPATEVSDEARVMATAVREDVDGAFQNLNAALAYLKALPSVDGDRLGSVGWCFGGQWSYEVAKNDLGVRSSVMYYGRFSPEDDLDMMKALVQGHFGEDDASIPVEDVRAFRAKLQEANGAHEIYIYPNAGHAFANEDNLEAYNPEAAEEAWERTLEFLRETL